MTRDDLGWRVRESLRLRVFEPAKLRWGAVLEQYAPRAAERLFSAAERAARLTHRDERSQLPSPFEINGARIDTVDDLQVFTQLPREVIVDVLTRREHLSFRAEWLGTPDALRDDRWFYLSSKSYLLNNAIHFPDWSFVDECIVPVVPKGGRVLDFGAGTGELTLRCVGRGLRVECLELNALQRDFLRFRIERHGLGERVKVLEPWTTPPREAFDAVVAIDVIEHLPNAAEVLDEKLLPSIAPDGALVEDSPFLVTSSNPMHHEDFGLEEHLRGRGMTLAHARESGPRIWRYGGKH